jgi:hypothetical protein
MRDTGLGDNQVYQGISRCWRVGLVLRTREPRNEWEHVNDGKAGRRPGHIRPFHLYMLKPPEKERLLVDGVEYVAFSEEYLDPRGGGGESKAGLIKALLSENRGKAFFSKDIFSELEGRILIRDVMPTVRRLERIGLVYIRGYKQDDRQSPFRQGYLLTWIDEGLPCEQAIEAAIACTDTRLNGEASASPAMERVHRIRDMILEHSMLKQLVNPVYFQQSLGCTEHELRHSLEKVMSLYGDLREVKLFDAYRHYYHTSLEGEELKAAVAMKENYLRLAKGRANRVGHNWEAVAEWFIDKFTTGARFWEQKHRADGMDQRRITLFLIKGVGGRRRVAEVDRIWEVSPGVFAPSITYVLSCKWGIVRKSDVDDFLEVLRWSKEFGVDTPDGRDVKQGVVGVFAASRFKKDENVRLRDETVISLAQYAARLNLQIISAAEFNEKLREYGCPKFVTVQKVSRYARDEAQVRESLNEVWKDPENSREVLSRLGGENKELYEFEKRLEE